MIQETIVLSLIYIAAVAIAFSPKTCKVEPVKKIEYFPEIEAVELAPIPSLENLPGEPVTPSPAPVSLPQAIAPEIPLTALGIRELKKLASKAKIKRYSSLNKQQLILALT